MKSKEANLYFRLYDSLKGSITKATSKVMINTWQIFLGEYEEEVVFVAVKKLIINKPTWPPSVGEVVQEIEKMRLSRRR
ncbi:replicative helicase loader/inhibitor [Natronospora cellulosivora (SeqCode)]